MTMRTGRSYMPPTKLRMVQADFSDKNSLAFQRVGWEALKKSIQGSINRLNDSNVRQIIKSLIDVNLKRGRGILCRGIRLSRHRLQAPYTPVYAALIAVINSIPKFKDIGRLMLTRLILQFLRGFKHMDKQGCLNSTALVAHLFNHKMVHTNIVLKILTLLLEHPTNDTVQVAVSFLKDCGQKLDEESPTGLNAAFHRLRQILYEKDVDKPVKCAIEVLF